MAIRLKQEGVEDFTVFERDTDVGGTWWANSYPGCQCDIPSHLYSYSFAPNPEWTRTYPLQEELGRYAARLCDALRRAGPRPARVRDERCAMGRGGQPVADRDQRR